MANIPLNYILSIQTDTTGAKKFTTVLNQAKATAQRFGINVSKSAKLASVKVSNSLNKQNQVVKRYVAVIEDGNRRIRTSFSQTATGMKQTGAHVRNVGQHAKKSRPFLANFTKALQRVAIVVPVWLLFRSVMMGVLSTIREGAEYWFEFDKSLQRSKQVVHGVTGSMEKSIDSLEGRIRQLSLESGKSMKELSDAFYQFGTVGNEFEESMQGMEVANKLATTIFGNSERTAKTLALAYRLLGDSIDSNIPKEERMAVVSAQIYKLWQTNAFTLDEFNESLSKFLPTASAFNIGMSESLALLATLNTASIKAGRGGRLLRTSINKLVENLDKASTELGVHFNPATDDAFDGLMKVLGAVKQLQKEGADIKELSSVMKDIFSGVRSREAGIALIAVYDTLLDNLDSVNTSTEQHKKLLQELDTAYAGVLDSVSKQRERTENLRKILGETFVKGVLGGEDFKETLKNLNLTLQASLPLVKKLGESWRVFRTVIEGGAGTLLLRSYLDDVAKKAKELTEVTNTLADAFARKLSVEELGAFIDKLKEPGGTDVLISAGYNTGDILYRLEGLLYILKEEIKKEKLSIPVDFGEEDFYFKKGKIFARLKTQTEAQLNLFKKETDYAEQILQGATKLEIAEQRITEIVKEKVRQYNNLSDVQLGIEDSISEEEAISLALKGNYEELKALFLKMLITDKEILEIEKQKQALIQEQYKDIESSTDALVSHELDLLKLRGASGAELLKTEIILKEALNLYDSEVDRLVDQLKLEKEITAEKLGQNKLSSDTVKLWEITQRYGEGIATEIGEVLTAQKSINDLSKKASRVFSQRFSGKFKQFQAGEFFFGGAGENIPIAERTTADINKLYTRIAERLKYDIVPKYEVPVSIKFNVNLAGIDLRVKNTVTQAVRAELRAHGFYEMSRDYNEETRR